MLLYIGLLLLVSCLLVLGWGRGREVSVRGYVCYQVLHPDLGKGLEWEATD